jgi:hypothetical protein
MPSTLHDGGLCRPQIDNSYLSYGSSACRNSDTIHLDHSTRSLEWRAYVAVKPHLGELGESHVMKNENEPIHIT